MNLIFLSRKTKIQIKRKQGTGGNNCKKYKIHERLLSFKYKYTHQNKHKNMKIKSTMSLEDVQRANKHGEILSHGNQQSVNG